MPDGAIWEAAQHMAHTLETIYGWWERGENVLDENKEYAKWGLSMWQAAVAAEKETPQP